MSWAISIIGLSGKTWVSISLGLSSFKQSVVPRSLLRAPAHSHGPALAPSLDPQPITSLSILRDPEWPAPVADRWLAPGL